jgi:uncharacterized glyoxalase superfamily protein PhnB/uncharacterized protein YndB with AHSA1/START domain
MSKQTTLKKDLANKRLIITREFDAPVDMVWRAWTDPEILDQWWAPKPWKTETVSMDFKVGGMWLYYMKGPQGEKHYCRADYSSITPYKNYQGLDGFCDEKGNINKEFPQTQWNVSFSPSATGTTVLVENTFKEIADIEKILEMGFEQGFAMAHGNLDEYLAAKFKLRNELNTNTAPRVVTYLNFPGTTEEAFKFYKSVFGGEFSGKGIQRFGDIPSDAGHPPVADNIKKMILHVELPILGGHIIMATDAPKEMGMTLTEGNNMHICLEPKTKAETKNLFDGLSKGGTVIMPLADMFFGSYFGECKDKFGINWMFNCNEKK